MARNPPVDIQEVAGGTPGATNPLPVRLSDGSAFYVASGGAGGGGAISTAAKGSTGAGSPTSTDVDANRQALDVYVRGGGAGGGAVTIADGADVALGAQADVAWVSGSGSLIAISKAEFAKLEAIRALLAGSIAVTGPLTDAQLRASAVPVSGPLTDAQLRASAVPVSGPLTDTQLRASAVPVSMATQNPDVTDRDARLLGRVKNLDSAGAVIDPALKGQLPAALAAGGGLKIEGVAGGVVVPVADGAGSLTVDAPVGTPVFVRLSDGAAAITALPVTDNSGSLTVDGTVTADTELPAAAALADATANPTTSLIEALLGFYNGSTWDRARGDTANGLDVDVTRMAALVAGAALVGRVNLDPQTANGLTISRVLSAASTNGTSVKASAGQVYGWYIYNVNAAVRYLKLYNKASAPTVGTDTPVMTIPIPPGQAANVEYTMGIAFATGIALALTTGVADADTGAVAANEIIINLLYK